MRARRSGRRFDVSMYGRFHLHLPSILCSFIHSYINWFGLLNIFFHCSTNLYMQGSFSSPRSVIMPSFTPSLILYTYNQDVFELKKRWAVHRFPTLATLVVVERFGPPSPNTYLAVLSCRNKRPTGRGTQASVTWFVHPCPQNSTVTSTSYLLSF